jgi:hypothetical protein
LARAQFGLTIKSAVYNLKRMSICWKWREEDGRPAFSAYTSPVEMSVFGTGTSTRLVFSSKLGF